MRREDAMQNWNAILILSASRLREMRVPHAARRAPSGICTQF
jgi:hypothetical protein